MAPVSFIFTFDTMAAKKPNISLATGKGHKRSLSPSSRDESVQLSSVTPRVPPHLLKASTRMQAHLAWKDESLDSIQSGVSRSPSLKQLSVEPPTPAPAPAGNTSMRATNPQKYLSPRPTQSLLNNGRGGSTSTRHAMVGTGSLDSILSETPTSARGSVFSHTSGPKPSMFQSFAHKGTVWHTTQPRVEQFYPLSELKLAESSDSGSELDFEPFSFSKSFLPVSGTWTMQDYDTQQYTAISVSAEQYGLILEQSLTLQASTLWDNPYHEDNPIYSLESCGFLETSTVDWVALYLQQLVYHSPNLETSVFITVPSMNQVLRLYPGTPPKTPWLSATPPGRMLIPIVDHNAKHYYMYHVVFGELDNNPPAHFYYVDSLGRASTKEAELQRDLFALEVVKWMLPFCQEVQEWEWDTVEWHQGCPASFRQAPGSLDCGLFVCQALLALAFDHCSALENMLPVVNVRSRLLWLMKQFASGEVQLGSQSSPPVWLLPLHQIPHETPSSLENYLDCPRPLVPLEDMFSVVNERKWPLPDAPWETKDVNLGLIEIEYSPSLAPSVAQNEPRDLGSPFNPFNHNIILHKQPSSSSFQSTKTPVSQTSTPSVSHLRYLSGKPRLENPFLKRKTALGSLETDSTPRKAKCNPFSRKNKARHASSGHIPAHDSITKIDAASPMPEIRGSSHIPTIQQTTAGTPPVLEDGPDDSFVYLSSFDELVYPESNNTRTQSCSKASSPPFHSNSQPKAPLHQMQLALSSPATGGGTSKLILHRPPLAASDTSQTQYSTTMSGMTFVHGKQATFCFPPPQDHRFAELFRDLSLPSTKHPPGFIYGTKLRNAQDVYKFTAAEPEMDSCGGEDIDAGVKVYCRPDGSHDQDTTVGMSIIQFCAFIDSLQDPAARHKVIFTATKPDGTPIVLNWLKDSLPLDKRWLGLSANFDSMSYTSPNLVFTIVVGITPWPDRARTLTNNVGIEIFHEGRARPLSHFPNFCMGMIGNNNQVRLNIFFPNYELERINNKHYKTYIKSTVYVTWYNEVFLGALDLLLETPPPNLRLACLHLKQELPKSYNSAADMATGKGEQGKTVKQYAVSPVIMNLLLPLIREIVDSKPHLAFMRGFFFHIFGMNLKTAAQSIPGQEADNAMGHLINTYPVVDFNKAGPDDLVFDYGLEVLVDSSKLPDTVQHATLLWNQAKALPIIAPNWNSPRMDAFCGSFVAGGFAAKAPAAARRARLISVQAYPKCKNETNVHRDCSIGCTFSPLDAMNNNDTFKSDMNKLKNAWKPWHSYGVRCEYRMASWAAMVCQGVPPAQWLDNLISGETIVAHPTANVVRLKEIFRSNYVQILGRTQALPPRIRQDTSATSLVAIVSHCIKSLVKRPDDHSTSREFVTRFHLAFRAHNYGYLCIAPEALCADLARVDRTRVPTEDLGIHNYLRRKRPAGARVKTSKQAPSEAVHPANAFTVSTNTGARKSVSQQQTSNSEIEDDGNSLVEHQGSALTEEDQQWLDDLINKEFPLFLWDNFPGRRANPEYALLQKPFSNKLWLQIAQPNVTKEPLVKGGSLFRNKLEIFFPENFLVRHGGSQWKAYQTRILQKLRQRAKDRAPDNLNQYHEMLRGAIFRIMAYWHFIPCPSTRAIWTYSGTGVTKIYCVVANPNVAH
ncbi:Replicase polyprotein 1ab [Rhizoctonia solani]|uniref:Replicase polyprotein 1ab n=1 Tax=Rhizoctonia solani TaxID=456999 RepID=A0A0K6FZ90_9AGAM|nr:Replicase polyprotein 1ab [Rhizoctonia solani]